jgi:hypothetical protein
LEFKKLAEDQKSCVATPVLLDNPSLNVAVFNIDGAEMLYNLHSKPETLFVFFINFLLHIQIIQIRPKTCLKIPKCL